MILIDWQGGAQAQLSMYASPIWTWSGIRGSDIVPVSHYDHVLIGASKELHSLEGTSQETYSLQGSK